MNEYDDNHYHIISYHTEQEEKKALTARTTFLMTENEKRKFLERLDREGKEASEVLRSFVHAYLETPEITKDPIRVTLVNSHPLLQPRISGKKEVFNLSLENAKNLFLTHGFVTKELKRRIVGALKGVSITPEEKSDLDTVMKAPEAKK